MSTGLEIRHRLNSVEGLLIGWDKVFGNGGGPGGDGETVAEFATGGMAEIERLARSLASGVYRPGPHRQVRIPKKRGGFRTLSIPCVRDRVVQSALAELLEEKAEAIFEPMSFAYRPGRSVKQAVAAIEHFRDQGYRHVVETDIEGFFDSVPHANMLALFGGFVGDAALSDLVALWLAAGDHDGNGLGLPQGSPLSPLLANLYLDSLDEAFDAGGVRAVRFADDFVILCRSAKRAEAVLTEVAAHVGKLGLKLNAEKTRIVSFDEGFRFLGHLFVRGIAMKSAQAEAQAPARAALAAAPESLPVLEAEPAPVPTVAAPELVPDDVWGTPVANLEGDIIHPGHGRSPLLRPLYVMEPRRTLDLRNEAFVVRDKAGELGAWSPRWIDRIELGPEAEVTAAALRQALAHRIPVHFVTGGGRPLGELAATLSRHGRRHLAQAKAVADAAVAQAMAREIVASKVHNQKSLLHRLNHRRKEPLVKNATKALGRTLAKLGDTVGIDTLRGHEGEAGQIYWPALGHCLEHGFTLAKRGRQEKLNPVALVLDALSAILTREVETMVLRAGLHPAFGFLHVVRDSEAAPVAYDLIEPFRAPLVEGLAIYLFNNRVLGKRHFSEGENGELRLFPEGRKRLIRGYEAWMARELRDPYGDGKVTWRGLVAATVIRFRAAIEDGAPFTAYRMDH